MTLHSRRLRRQDLSFSYEHSRMHLSRSLQHSTSQVLRFYALVAYILGYLVHSPQQNSFIPVTLQSSQGSFTLAGFGLQLCTFTNTQSLQHCLFNTLLPRFFASMPLSPTNLATWFTLLSKTCSYLSPYNPARGRLRWLDLGCSSAHSRTHSLFNTVSSTLYFQGSSLLCPCRLQTWLLGSLS